MKTRHALYIDALGDENKQRNYYTILFLTIKNYYSVCDTIIYTGELRSLGLMTLKVVDKNKIFYIYIYKCIEIFSFPSTLTGRRNCII